MSNRLRIARLAARTTGLAAVASLTMVGAASAATVGVFEQTLTYFGDPVAEALTVTQTAPTVVVFDLAGAPVDSGDAACVASNTNAADVDNEVTCTLAGLDAIFVRLQEGNDSAVTNTAVRTTVLGGDGDDRIDLTLARFDSGPDLAFGSFFFGGSNSASGEAGNDTLIASTTGSFLGGDAGNDVLTGAAGDDRLDGGEGSDALAAGAGDDYLSGGGTFTSEGVGTSDGADTIDGGDGVDTVSYAGRTVGVRVDLNVPAGHGSGTENDTIANIENIEGGNGDDALIGNAVSNTILGFDGRDAIEGRGAFDELRGGRDADSIGASGDVVLDLIDCGRGFSTIAGASGTDADVARLDYLDMLTTTADCETVRRNSAPARAPQLGTGEDDRILGDGNKDLLIGLLGDDFLAGFEASDELQGGFGNDTLYGGPGADDLIGGHGNDRVFGGEGNDSMFGGPGTDTLRGGEGIDTLMGGEGIDNLDGNAGRDYLIARDGEQRGDTVTCTRTALVAQRDVVYVDANDLVRNAAFCGKVSVG